MQRPLVDGYLEFVDYMTAIETALGEAYSEPAADVRGYVDSMKPALT